MVSLGAMLLDALEMLLGMLSDDCMEVDMHLILFGSGNALQMNVGKYWNWSLFYIYWKLF